MVSERLSTALGHGEVDSFRGTGRIQLNVLAPELQQQEQLVGAGCPRTRLQYQPLLRLCQESGQMSRTGGPSAQAAQPFCESLLQRPFAALGLSLYSSPFAVRVCGCSALISRSCGDTCLEESWNWQWRRVGGSPRPSAYTGCFPLLVVEAAAIGGRVPPRWWISCSPLSVRA